MIQQMCKDLLFPGSGDAVLLQAGLFQHLHESFSGGVFVNGSQEITEVWSVGGDQLGIGPYHRKLPVSAQRQHIRQCYSFQNNLLTVRCTAGKYTDILIWGLISNQILDFARLWNDEKVSHYIRLLMIFYHKSHCVHILWAEVESNLQYWGRFFRYLYLPWVFIFLTTFYFSSLHANTVTLLSTSNIFKTSLLLQFECFCLFGCAQNA